MFKSSLASEHYVFAGAHARAHMHSCTDCSQVCGAYWLDTVTHSGANYSHELVYSYIRQARELDFCLDAALASVDVPADGRFVRIAYRCPTLSGP